MELLEEHENTDEEAVSVFERIKEQSMDRLRQIDVLLQVNARYILSISTI